MTWGRLPVHALVVGALGCVSYRPAPVDAPALAAAYTARRLDDTSLVRFLVGAGVEPPDSVWHPRELSLVALYFHPELDAGRAAWREAVAGEISAGVRPQPSTEATVERAAKPDEGKTTPWSVALTAGLTVETGGKRAARIARAQAAALAAGLDLNARAWQVAEDAEAAAHSAASADRSLQFTEAEAATLQSVLRVLRARYAQGAATLSEVARAQADVQSAAMAVLEAQRERLAARGELARAVALPAVQLDSLHLAVDSTSSCAVLDSTTAPALERDALHVRYDLGAALAAYAAAEADLRLAVADQYPDLALGPGVGWNEGVGKWSFGLGLPRILLHRNRGPIAEAEARRAGAAAHLEQVQQAVLGAITTSAAQCGQAKLEVAQTDTLVGDAARRLDLANAAYQRGETGETEVAFARLALVRARHAQALATGRLGMAGVELERAVGRWVIAPLPRWPDVTQAPRP